MDDDQTERKTRSFTAVNVKRFLIILAIYNICIGVVACAASHLTIAVGVLMIVAGVSMISAMMQPSGCAFTFGLLSQILAVVMLLMCMFVVIDPRLLWEYTAINDELILQHRIIAEVILILHILLFLAELYVFNSYWQYSKTNDQEYSDIENASERGMFGDSSCMCGPIECLLVLNVISSLFRAFGTR
ncbi:hypothetical protein QR680_015889 [Steinernema hermaphroditum]|uniref:Uncharacterized protein n=1 Tax=Steinernema hermaphroditum TaxID=289476 RepID=A0AA39HBV1_9BILA|nr:hypothetical protein QR680_015889 [Steinernema hermaphroditum]